MIFLAQTPQAFRRDVFRDAIALDVDATDEASLAEQAGHQVRLVEGDGSNIKITTPEDVAWAEAIAATRDGRPVSDSDRMRIGTGYDLHRLVEGRPLVLGGVTIPADRGALGHSDADVVCHAVTDAMLGAASLGDIGLHFPIPTSAGRMLRVSISSPAPPRCSGLGASRSPTSTSRSCSSGRVRPHIEAMRQAIAGRLAVDLSCVSIKAKTNEGVDAVGRGEAVAAHAVALLRTRNKELGIRELRIPNWLISNSLIL